MANTYLTMQQRIADEFVNESITTAQIKNAIQTAISYYQNTPFFFNQKITTFTTIGGRQYYDASDLADIPNIFQMRNATIALNGTNLPLDEAEFNDIDDTQTGSFIGFPYLYAYYTQKIRLFPIPDSGYIVTLSFIQNFTALSADTDTNSWMVEAEAMIRQRAKMLLAIDILHSDDMAARCKNMEDEEYDGLMDETRQRSSTKSLRYPALLGNRRSFNIFTGR